MPAPAESWLSILLMILGVGAVSGGAYWTAGAVRIIRAIRQFPSGDDGAALPLPEPAPAVCLVIPAHNEGHAIAGLIASLRAQTYPSFSVVLSLDRCTDDTDAVARAAIGDDPRFTIFPIDSCPENWAGKTHAVWRAVTDAPPAKGAPLLLFADADTQFHPSCVRAAVALLHQRSLGLLSFLSSLSVDRWYELVAQPAAALELLRQYPLTSSNRWPKPRAFANGQFMLFTREAYDAAGGHEAVRTHLLEDIAIARHTARAGHRTGVLPAGNMLHCRMYENWSAFRRGWRRIYTEAANRRSKRLAVSARRVLLTLVLAPVAAALAVFVALPVAFDRSNDWLPWTVAALGLTSLAIYLFALGYLARASKAPIWTAALQPLGGLLVADILLQARRHLRRGRSSSWGGMSYYRADRDHPADPGTTNL